MPIWIELIFLLLGLYAFGLGIGWLVWGRGDMASSGQANTQSNESDET